MLMSLSEIEHKTWCANEGHFAEQTDARRFVLLVTYRTGAFLRASFSRLDLNNTIVAASSQCNIKTHRTRRSLFSQPHRHQFQSIDATMCRELVLFWTCSNGCGTAIARSTTVLPCREAVGERRRLNGVTTFCDRRARQRTTTRRPHAEARCRACSAEDPPRAPRNRGDHPETGVLRPLRARGRGSGGRVGRRGGRGRG